MKCFTNFVIGFECADVNGRFICNVCENLFFGKQPLHKTSGSVTVFPIVNIFPDQRKRFTLKDIKSRTNIMRFRLRRLFFKSNNLQVIIKLDNAPFFSNAPNHPACVPKQHHHRPCCKATPYYENQRKKYCPRQKRINHH